MTLEQMEQRLAALEKDNRAQKAIAGMWQQRVKALESDKALSDARWKWVKETLAPQFDALQAESYEWLDAHYHMTECLKWAFGVDSILEIYKREQPRWKKAQEALKVRRTY